MIQFDNVMGGNHNKAGTICIYKMFLAREKALYQALNMMKWQDQTFIGYFWAPTLEEQKIQSIVSNFSAVKIRVHLDHNIKRPTFIRTNDVTEVFQEIVDTYGIPNYREANPAVLTVVTYPFFFGMMFGDMGHGSIYLAGGILLTLLGDRLKANGMEDVARIRYLILFMGFFAFYCGFIYNEWFAIQTNILGSCYDLNDDKTTIMPNDVGDRIYRRLDY